MTAPGRSALRTALCALLVATAAACASPEASRRLYQWSDAEGNVHYTPFPDRVPVARRDTRRLVEPGRSAAQNAADLPAPAPAPQRTAARPAPPVPPPADPADLDAQIAALEARIAADEEAIKAMISDPAQAEALRDSDALREIANRLPELQAELARLRAARDGGAASDDVDRDAPLPEGPPDDR